jgi:phosphoribosylanthranilate isomerase
MTQVKICGLNAAAAIRAAATADFAGFIFFPRSPRHVEPDEAARLAAALPRAVRRVAVMVDPDDAMLRNVLAQFRPDLVQLHGAETPERVASIRHGFSIGVIKAVPIAEPHDLDRARAYEEAVDWLMFDAKPPARPDALPGGNATSFDWGMLAGRRWARPWFLSGGLGPDNVADAIRLTGAPAVDVSSGVEDRPGRKSVARIAAFLDAVRGRAPGTAAAPAR